MSSNVTEARQANRARFLHNYRSLGGRDMELFEALVQPLMSLASANAPCPMPEPLIQRQPVRDKLLTASLAKLGGEYQTSDQRELLPWGRPVEAEALIA